MMANLKLKTWEIVKDYIEKKQPVKAVEITNELGLTPGQTAGALATLRNKNLVTQAENKAYLIRYPEMEDFLLKDLEELLENYPKPDSKSEQSASYIKLYEELKNILEKN